MEVKIRTSRSYLRFVLPLALPAGIFALASFVPLTSWLPQKAPVVKLYPTTCLGGWENPKNAEGAPSLPEKSPSSAFNDRNSSVLRDSLAQIFCADFQNTFSDGAFPKKMVLRFSWSTVAPAVSRVKKAILEAPVSETSTLLDESFASTTEQLNATTSESVNASTTKTEDSLTDSSVSEPDEDIPTLIQKTSFNSKLFLNKLFTVAFAESATGTIASSQISTTTEHIASSSEKVAPVSDKPKYGGADFLQVLYTFDGQEWKELGMVTRENLADLSFQVPISTPEDLTHFQVSLQNLISLDDPPVIYLDGMWLEAAE
jgi:hypothetical protein